MTGMQSNVGNSQVYEDGDQRFPKRRAPEAGAEAARLGAGLPKDTPYVDFDPLDKRSITERIAAAAPHTDIHEENRRTVSDPLAPARAHGNEPSRGAKVDAQLKAEEAEMLKNKGKA
ncbi:hypothetical protein AX16_000713 [Volvariella volvacea WC 439]|nr:hypothetical protein AX16_000713 [Volvariella volvacea WC 439]